MKHYISLFKAGLILLAAQTAAQNSAPSSHLVFNDRFDGDIIINEVRVPASGEAMYTYYEALGWGGQGAGYAGIQAHPKAHNFIFSIWDHKSHSAPIKAVYHGPGTKTEGFGGEGTGLKSWNFTLGWSTDTWHTLVARNWPVGDHTFYGCWTRSAETGAWTHLITMDVAVADARFHGGTDAFIEDWLNTGKHARTSHLRGGWKRKTDGSWFPFSQARYSVNAWDLTPGKRSYSFRENWNGGIAEDASGAYYFMTSGGAETQPHTTNPSTHTVERKEAAPTYATLILREINAALTDAHTLQVNWEADPRTAPPFAYHIELFDPHQSTTKPLATESETVPHARSATIDVSGIKQTAAAYIQMSCTDILDRRSETHKVPINWKQP
jgi:hypothetical protein